MTNHELAAALAELGLSKNALARLTGTDRNTVYRWLREDGAKGALPVPQYVDTIVDLLRERRHAKPAAGMSWAGDADSTVKFCSVPK